jgi:hypothetical protein
MDTLTPAITNRIGQEFHVYSQQIRESLARQRRFNPDSQPSGQAARFSGVAPVTIHNRPSSRLELRLPSRSPCR